MPLYELVLRYDDREEIRLTVAPFPAAKQQVVSKRAPSGDQAKAAFLCELARAIRDGGRELLDEPKRRDECLRNA